MNIANDPHSLIILRPHGHFLKTPNLKYSFKEASNLLDT